MSPSPPEGPGPGVDPKRGPVAQDVSVVGTGMTRLDRRDAAVADLAVEAVAEAVADAGVEPGGLGLVVLANALGGRLLDQGCIRGQSWLRRARLDGSPVVNVDNSCAGGASALHLAVLAAAAGRSPVLAVGVEKMWTGDRAATLAGIADGLPADERAGLGATHDNPSGSVLMGLNATWVRRQLAERGTTAAQVAGAAVKARRLAAANPKAQWHQEVTVDEVLASPTVVPPLTRLMCSSFTDGAAAVVVTAGSQATRGVRVRASVLGSGSGELEYHERLRAVAEDAWKEAQVGPDELDVVELHDATAAEELYAAESVGLFEPGEAGAATVAGRTLPGGAGVCVNPSGGLVGRGHPLGATGLCQVVELADQLRGRAGQRQVPGARLAAAVNTGGVVAGDAAVVAVHVLERI